MQISILEFSAWTSNAVITILILALTFKTIIEILLYTGILRGPRFEKLGIGQTFQNIANTAARNVFEELGINEKKKNSLRDNVSLITKGYKRSSDNRCLKELLILLAHNSHRCPPSTYGRDTLVKTEVIINTMEAALDNRSRDQMSDLLTNLYSKCLQDTGCKDFILVPKSGNPILAKKFADSWNAVCIVCKSDVDRSRVSRNIDNISGDVPIQLNLEGFTYLQERARESKTPLKGIIIDCNCSGGSGLINAADEFNHVVRAYDSGIEAIDKGMVLFRVDVALSPSEFNTKFKFNQNGPLSISRYIDLNEDIKEELAELKESIYKSKGEVHSGLVQDKLNELVTLAYSKGLIMIE